MSIDLGTTYLGLTLRNPVIVSSSPLSADVDAIRQLEDYGAGAVVLPSLFEEQIRQQERQVDTLVSVGAESTAEVGSYFPAASEYNAGPVGYLDLVAKARAAVDVPVIASLNGTSDAGWVEYATLIEQAGASALELNIYRIASGLSIRGGDVDASCIALLKSVCSRVNIPVAVKLHPHFSAFGALARELDEAGANGLVLFNRLYQPDIDLASLRWSNDLCLSDKNEIRLGLLWLSLLSGRLPHTSLAAGTGVETADEVVKYLLAGADAVMTASSLLRHGPRHLQSLISGLETWLESRDFASVAAMRGLMRPSHPQNESETHPQIESEAQERGNYIKSLLDYRGPYVQRK